MSALVKPSRLVLLGHPIAHSLSPVFQNAALRYIGSTLRYELLDVTPARLHDTLDALAAEGAAGNVTVPHKSAVASRARCTALAERVGAVNTFWHVDGMLHGDNTDVAGVSASITALCPFGVAETRCVVIGAGGSAAAAIVALSTLGCGDIVIAARNAEGARRLAAHAGISVRVVSIDDPGVGTAGLVINATPIGMTDECMPVPPSALSANTAALDLVYRRNATAWVRACRERGHRAEDGLRMLLAQGASAFERWFGVPAPREAMSRALIAEAGRCA
ncbi:MAG: shikimate dehydrogenase [Gemmatimonadaceae bacterium]|nr:shikimate dehydrogenase [Gemmatimonadaceae bacterium]